MTDELVRTLPHRRGLDGLRAVAVLAVLLYHADVSWMPGGFLGVDVFFAISGYLITSLLLVDVEATGGVSLRRFWARRARRLLPALGALLVGVTVAALVGATDAAARLRGDVVAALTYSSNWWQIIRGETYFETFARPPMLRHLWSLAVEEQLYILLPLAVAVAARRGWLAHRHRLAIGVFAAAVASLVLLNALWDEVDPSRAWFGSDTRGGALLVGVGCALLFPMAHRARWSGTARDCIDAVAVAALVVLVLLFVHVGELDHGLPRWGFGLAALASGVLVVAITSPSCTVARYLSVRPLVWLGTRSYAAYLWHWPVYVLTRPDVDVPLDGFWLLVLRLLITFALSELSWRFVEQPIRTGAFVRHWWQLRRTARVRIALAATSATVVFASAVGVGLAAVPTPEPPELLAAAMQSSTTATTLLQIPTTTSTVTSLPTTAVPPATVAAPATTTTAPPPPPAPWGYVLAVGDSVMLSAQHALSQGSGGRILVDAAVARQVHEGLDVLQRYKDAGAFTQVSAVVVHLGTNGPLDDDQFNRLAAITAEVPRVVVLNVRVPKPWEERSNAAINGGSGRFPFMRLANWYWTSGQPDMLASDGVHPSHAGARAYTYIVMEQLDGAPPSQGPPPTVTTTTTTTTTTAPPPPPPPS